MFTMYHTTSNGVRHSRRTISRSAKFVVVVQVDVDSLRASVDDPGYEAIVRANYMSYLTCLATPDGEILAGTKVGGCDGLVVTPAIKARASEALGGCTNEEEYLAHRKAYQVALINDVHGTRQYSEPRVRHWCRTEQEAKNYATDCLKNGLIAFIEPINHGERT